MPIDETGVLDANFSSSYPPVEGQYYPKGERQRLKESYKLYRYAVERVKRTPEGMYAYLSVMEAYFGSEADPGIVAHWRKVSPVKAQTHDWFIGRVADELEGIMARVGVRDIYVSWPHRMSVKEEARLDQRNDEVYAEYCQIKEEKLAEGLSGAKANKRAVDTAAIRHGYSTRRVYEIVRIRQQEREAG